MIRFLGGSPSVLTGWPGEPSCEMNKFLWKFPAEMTGFLDESPSHAIGLPTNLHCSRNDGFPAESSSNMKGCPGEASSQIRRFLGEHASNAGRGVLGCWPQHPITPDRGSPQNSTFLCQELD